MGVLARVLVAVLGLAWAVGAARAEVPEIRFAQQFSMGYLQFDVMRHRNLLQKHAALLGLPEVKVTYIVFNGPDMMNDALLSGAIDVASGGVPGLPDDLGQDARHGAGGARHRGDVAATGAADVSGSADSDNSRFHGD